MTQKKSLMGILMTLSMFLSFSVYAKGGIHFLSIPGEVIAYEEQLKDFNNQIRGENPGAEGFAFAAAQLRHPEAGKYLLIDDERKKLLRDASETQTNDGMCLNSQPEVALAGSAGCSFNFAYQVDDSGVKYGKYVAGAYTTDEAGNPVEAKWKDSARLATFGIFAIGEALIGPSYYRNHCNAVRLQLRKQIPACQ